MSEESATPPETSATPEGGGTPANRRVSNPRPKKKAKSPKLDQPAEEGSAERASKFPEFPETTEPASTPRNDWPEPEAPSSGNENNPKRKRRRKKGKGGNNPQNAAPPAADGEETAVSQPQRPQQQGPRVKLDPELLAKFAWKIYLAEVSEEGVALVSDSDAKELTRRCFRLAEIFLEEQARRR